MYDCDTCELPMRDLKAKPIQCPKCPLIHLYVGFKRETIEEVERRYKGFPQGWDFQSLHDLYTEIGAQLAERNNHISLNWSVTIATLARIVIDERFKAKRIDDWNRQQKSKS